MDCGEADKVLVNQALTTAYSAPMVEGDDESIDEEEDQYVIEQLTQATFRKSIVDVATSKDDFNKSNSDEQFALRVLQKVKNDVTYFFFQYNMHYQTLSNLETEGDFNEA